jgi:50S ribosomal subunit-associated GTPase HflX
LERLTDWVDRLRETAPESELLIVGNKTDERANGSGVSHEEGLEFARRHGAQYVEVSAKTGEGIDDMFERIAQSLMTKYLEQNKGD